MSNELVVIARLLTPGGEVRDQVIKRLKIIAQEAQDAEPSTTVYAILVPREDDGTTIFVAEWYKDQAAFDLHMKSQSVKEILDWPVSKEFSFSRPTAAIHSDPHVIIAELDYVPGGVETSTRYWKAVDPNAENKLYTFEAYESPEYLKSVHVPSDAVAENIKNTKHLRTGLKHNVLKMIGGYLYKE
uniref:ABM domain-containing protein n=1 Tax=Bionectria ochroleuca TaxID=29856 RepID=A0A8H7K701_BIOOC